MFVDAIFKVAPGNEFPSFSCTVPAMLKVVCAFAISANSIKKISDIFFILNKLKRIKRGNYSIL
jgi:hypothetical protein